MIKLKKLYGVLQLLQQELLHNAIAAEYLSIPLQILQFAVVTVGNLHDRSEESDCVQQLKLLQQVMANLCHPWNKNHSI